MPENKLPAQTPPPFVFNKQLLLDKLNERMAYQEQFAGKPNHNPFMWIKKNLTPLFLRLTGGKDDLGRVIPIETSKELHDSILAVKYEPCIINHELGKVQSSGVKPQIVISASGTAMVKPPGEKK